MTTLSSLSVSLGLPVFGASVSRDEYAARSRAYVDAALDGLRDAFPGVEVEVKKRADDGRDRVALTGDEGMPMDDEAVIDAVRDILGRAWVEACEVEVELEYHFATDASSCELRATDIDEAARRYARKSGLLEGVVDADSLVERIVALGGWIVIHEDDVIVVRTPR